MASLESWAPLMARLPRLSNAIMFNPFARWFAERLFGLIHLPHFARNNIHQFKRHMCDLNDLHQLGEVERTSTVLLLQDPFTSFFDENTLSSSIQVLEAMGKNVRILPFIPLGKAQHVKGMLTSFELCARSALAQLQKLAAFELPIVCLESTQTLMFRQEYAGFSAQYPLPKIWAIHEYLASQEILTRATASSPVYLFSHCSEKTQMGASVEQWQLVFKKFGMELKPVATGCCGMAGSYGHELEHKIESQTLWQQSWADSLSLAASKGHVCASGFSCRQQTLAMASVPIASPLQLLANALEQNG